jgi:predicted DNA-binding transcriptional regulator YafY
MLKQAGFDIESTKCGSYLNARRFETSELRMLVDCVLSFKHINEKHSLDLIGKIASLGGTHFKMRLQHVHHVTDWPKSTNFDFFYNVEVLDAAIEKGRKASFFYNRYGTDKKFKHTTESKHIVSPYQFLFHNQYYFLIAKPDCRESLAFFRLDRITDIEMLTGECYPLHQIPDFRNGLNLAEIAATLPYLYFDKPVDIELKCGEAMLGDIVDWFGKDFVLSSKNDGFFVVTVKASPPAIVHWLMQYNVAVEVLAPQSVRNAVIEKTRRLTKLYGLPQNR